MRARTLISFCIAIAVLQSCKPALPEDVASAYAELPDAVDYNVHVKPILSDKCFACHGPDAGKRKARLRLDIAEAAFAPLEESPGKVAIDPGDLDDSEVFHRILSDDPEYKMPDPESHLTLSEKEKAILIKWIEQGATYKPHWAFIEPKPTKIPDVRDREWVVTPIDNFILSTLEEAKLQPGGAADKELLLRRVSLDLTGLPPTLEEIESFLADNSPDAYEKQVDRLLASPHYGEKQAVHWLDVARFADSHGYSIDRVRDMSPYRDWVIKAFNQNLPYDKFIHWQLAGDLMPSPTKEMIVATAFNRNHQHNMEGGIIEEEFQTEYVIDRTNTFGEAFMGLSLGCARCHDHKFDPVSQKNYFELYSFFNNVKEAGQISFDDAMPTPTLLLPSDAQEKMIRYLETLVEEENKKIERLQRESDPAFHKWLSGQGYAQLAKEQMPGKGLVAYYTFDNGDLNNLINRAQKGQMKQQSGNEVPVFENREAGKALALNGDVWLDLNEVGIFRRSEPFTVGLALNIPEGLKEGVIFHKCIAERLYNFRGYHLYYKNGKLELSMAHTAPSNAITRISQQPVVTGKWIQITVTYDGSSKAEGLKLYIDGSEVAMETITDQLYKDILFYQADGYRSKNQPGLQIGAWDRGSGFTGGKVDDITVYNRRLTAFEVKVLARQAVWPDHTKRRGFTPAELKVLREYYVTAVDEGIQKELAELTKRRTALADSTEKVKEIMVMQEMREPRQAYILDRGNYDAPTEKVFPDTPPSILPFLQALPRNRYGLAQWLTEKEHPLTARVAVNRLWQNFFGTGLVKTSEDFGNQGEMPSHPGLLDWLAISFRQSGWDIKAMNKLIVMSMAYRQDSRASAAAHERDPDNRLLSHGPSFRMSAEMIRDNALAASGLLNRSIGGKSVKPYQPEGLWHINNVNYVQDTGKAVYRRSLYILAKRSVPNPTLATFDGTSRSYCVVRRQNTNTPLQALVMLNDPTFVEAATALGLQMAKVGERHQAISGTFRKLTGRLPSEKELALLMELHGRQLARFKQHPDKATGWLNAGQLIVDKNVDRLAVAANAVVASTILNADACLTKR